MESLLSKSNRKAMYPKDHIPGMRVPKGGSSCSKCEYLADNQTECKNKYFKRWHGSATIPGKIDEYCSDWFEPADGELG
jgi:hypothetical protein